MNLQTAHPRRAGTAGPAHVAARSMLPLIVLAMPFLDIPGIAGGAYVKPLVMPLVLLAWVCILVRTGGRLSLARDITSRRWLLLAAWVVVGAICMPLINDMPHEMKGHSLGGRIIRDLIAFFSGLMCWFYLRLAIQTDDQAVGALRWALRSFFILLPLIVLQSLFLLTGAAWIKIADEVLDLMRSPQAGAYKKIFGLAPEGSMLADQLLTLYLPFTLASILLRASVFRRWPAGLSVETWITALAVCALLFTQSRIGLVALLVLVFFGWVLDLRWRSQREKKWRSLMLPVVALTFLAALTTVAGDRLNSILGSFSSVDDSIDGGVWSNVTRLGSMSTGIDMALHHPLGVGTGSFAFLFERHVPEWALISPEIDALVSGDTDYFMAASGSESSAIAERLPDAKALPVRVLAELGLPGFVLIGMVWCGLALGCWRRTRIPSTPGTVRIVAFGALLSLITMLPLSFSSNSYVWVHWIFVGGLAATVGEFFPVRRRFQQVKAGSFKRSS